MGRKVEGTQRGEGEVKWKENRVRNGTESGRETERGRRGKVEGKQSEEWDGKWKGDREGKERESGRETE